ncbi:hypothetical protein ABIA39_001563 [Nocardia sp. GAS34]|uniref:DMP19 family protein n=1 Tax=unclassified Nocardia TaxID=2637762 RepID=UPI003D1F7223
MGVYNDRLQHMGQSAAQFLDTDPDLDEENYNLLYTIVLAADFDYQVKNGGFAQLIFNLGRDRLEHCHVMLTTVNAPVALSFYVRAIKLCVENPADFDQLMADFSVPTVLGQNLISLTVEYLRGANSFDAEVAEFIDSVGEHMRAGLRASPIGTGADASLGEARPAEWRSR